MKTLRKLKYHITELWCRVRLHWDGEYSVIIGNYDKRWDKYMLYLIKEFDFTEYSKYVAKIGDEYIWIENFPAAFGRKWTRPDHNIDRRALSRRTIQLLHAKLQRDIQSEVAVYNAACGIQNEYN